MMGMRRHALYFKMVEVKPLICVDQWIDSQPLSLDLTPLYTLTVQSVDDVINGSRVECLNTDVEEKICIIGQCMQNASL